MRLFPFRNQCSRYCSVFFLSFNSESSFVWYCLYAWLYGCCVKIKRHIHFVFDNFLYRLDFMLSLQWLFRITNMYIFLHWNGFRERHWNVIIILEKKNSFRWIFIAFINKTTAIIKIELRMKASLWWNTTNQ